MSGSFNNDRVHGDVLAEFIYTQIFLGDDGLAIDPSRVELIDYDSNMEAQYAGIDIVVCDNEGKQFNVDVKSAVNSSGQNSKTKQPLGTFVQEISYIKNGIVKDGWFIDQNKRTDAYAFVWIPEVVKGLQRKRKSGYYRIESEEDALLIEVAIVGVRNLKAAILKDLGKQMKCCSIEEINVSLKNMAGRIRKRELGDYVQLANGYKMAISRKLAEQPINLIVPKSIIKDVSTHAFLIRRRANKPEIKWAVVPW